MWCRRSSEQEWQRAKRLWCGTSPRLRGELTSPCGGAFRLSRYWPHFPGLRLRAPNIRISVPTLEELGYPQFTGEVASIFLMAPAATPAPILDRLNEATNRVQKNPEVISRLNALALAAPPADISRAAIRALAEQQLAAWARAVKTAAGP